MTPNLTMPCALGITEETLSALRDGLLDTAEARQLGHHARTCGACQERLRAFDAVGAAVAAQGVPDLQASVWRGLQGRIAQNGERRTMRRGPLYGGLAAIAAVVLVALFAAVLLNAHGVGPISGTPTASQSANTTATVTRTATRTPPSTGWQAAAIHGTPCTRTTIAATLVNSQTLYACVLGSNGKVALSVSHDGGATWDAPLPTPADSAPDNGAALAVNPTSTPDILLAEEINQGPNVVYRSPDGGAHWQRQTGLGNLTFEAMGWAGSTALVLTQLTESAGTPLAELYASHNGGPFARIDQNGKVGGYDLSQSPLLLVTGYDVPGVGNTILLTFGQAVAPIYTTSLRSTDGGATWQQVTLKDDAGKIIDPLAASPDGYVLAGVYQDAPQTVVSSHDGGADWNRSGSVNLPTGVPGVTQLVAADDGAIFVTSSTISSATAPDMHVYELVHGASTWTSPVSLPDAGYIFFLQQDTIGDPAALWVTAGDTLYMHQLPASAGGPTG